jgi:hypothetical protein
MNEDGLMLRLESIPRSLPIRWATTAPLDADLRLFNSGILICELRMRQN